jgi:hypothetical protein
MSYHVLSSHFPDFHPSQHGFARFIMDTTTHHYALSALQYNITDHEPLPKYEPVSPKVVFEMKDVLLKILPLEIVEFVIEYAEYWPRTTVTTRGRTTKLGSSGNAFIVSLSVCCFLFISQSSWFLKRLMGFFSVSSYALFRWDIFRG